MTLLQRPLLVLLLLVTHHLLQCWIAFGSVDEEGQKQEEFNEELLLKPLPDRKVLAHFHFQSSAPPSTSNGRHHHLFPKAISQLVLIVALICFIRVTEKSSCLERRICFWFVRVAFV